MEGGYRVGRGWPGKESSPAAAPPLPPPERTGAWPPHQLSQMRGSSGSRGKSVKGKKLHKQVGLTRPRDSPPLPPRPGPSEAGGLDSKGCRLLRLPALSVGGESLDLDSGVRNPVPQGLGFSTLGCMCPHLSPHPRPRWKPLTKMRQLPS